MLYGGKVELEYIETSMFLCNSKAIQEFSKNFANYFKKNYTDTWSIICERKEDLITIRNQVLHEISKEMSINESDTFFGISMYTIDNLARNFCSSIASTTNSEILHELPNFISKPYLEITTQELFIEIILKNYGYVGDDSLTIAKQILSFIDITWPQDTDFINLIISTQNKNNINTVQEISEKFLRQILATYQYARYELSNYSRLQLIIKEYFQENFINHLFHKSNALILPIKFLKGNILWVSAPEYINATSNDFNITIKPGNFQSYFVDEFKKYILISRNKLNKEKNIFISSRTIIKDFHNNLNLDNNHIHYFIAENRHYYSKQLEINLKDKKSINILADFDPGQFRENRSDAAGTYHITPKILEEWNKSNFEFTDASEIFPQIDAHFESFLDQISLINDKKKLYEIGNKYSLDVKINNENSLIQLFQKNIERETFYIGYQHPIQQCPKALSFIASEKLPQKIIITGPAHSATSISFHVKVLNNAISLLRKQGVSIDLPASEMMYRGFWKNIANLKIPLEFWLANSAELNKFPNYLTPKNNIHKFGISFSSEYYSHLFEKFQPGTKNMIPNWQDYINKKTTELSITSFEKYINCPLQFLLSELIGIKKKETEHLSTDHIDIGSRMHLIAEQLISRLVTLLGNNEYNNIIPSVFKDIIENIRIQENFLSFNKNKWIKIIKNSVEKKTSQFAHEIINAINESIETIWQINKESKKTNFSIAQEREILKRTFLRFLHIEINNSENKYTGIAREKPVSLELGGMKFSGKIDRIDATSKGLNIIDYKTSNFPKNEKRISLFPSELQEIKTSKFSAQGALYCLALAEKMEFYEDDIYQNKIKSFSLYYLKNLDFKKNPILSYEFNELFEKDSLTFKKLSAEYTEYALKLKQGNFYPNPIKTNVCEFCNFKLLCPYALKVNINEINEIDS